MPKQHILLLLIFLALLAATPAQAAPQANAQADTALLDFPNTVTFSATLSAPAEIVEITLEYGTRQLTCGEVTAKAFPQFTPAATTTATWTWDMRQSGSLPPGAQLWWRWRYVDVNGKEYLSETQTTTWLDDTHNWQTLSAKMVNIHYYGLDDPSAQAMLAAGQEGLKRVEQAGMNPDIPVEIYVYPSYDEMREAVLFEPQWTGGQAYSDFSIIIMGTSGDAKFDAGTVIHEVTHILVGRNAFTCIGFIPTWLNEGLAVYNEGELDGSLKTQYNLALRDDTFFPLRSLGGSFSEIPEKALLSYAQSYSVVKFMLETHGQEKMSTLLTALSDAQPIDDALLSIYGFDTDGLDNAWRASLELSPSVIAQATAQPAATFVPTYVPIQGVPQAITATPYEIPDSTGGGENSNSGRQAPPLALTLSLLCFCLVFALLIGVIVLGVVLRLGNKKTEKAG